MLERADHFRRGPVTAHPNPSGFVKAVWCGAVALIETNVRAVLLRNRTQPLGYLGLVEGGVVRGVAEDFWTLLKYASKRGFGTLNIIGTPSISTLSDPLNLGCFCVFFIDCLFMLPNYLATAESDSLISLPEV